MADENPTPSISQSPDPSRASRSPVPAAFRARPSIVSGGIAETWSSSLVVVVAVLLGGAFLWRYLDSYESTDDAQADVHLYPVSARIPGYVVKVNVGDNQWVEQGTVLVEIDPKDYEVALAQAQANLAGAEATAQSLNIAVPITTVSTTSQIQATASDIDNANAGVIAAERQLTAAHAQLEQAQATDVRAQADLQRYKLLVDKREVAPQVYDQALASAKEQHGGGGRRNSQRVRRAAVRAAGAQSCDASASELPVRADWAAAGIRDAGSGARRDCGRAATARIARAGPTESAIHKDGRAGRGRREQDRCGWAERATRTAAFNGRAARRRVGHRQF